MAIAESFQAQPSSHQIRLPQDSEYNINVALDDFKNRRFAGRGVIVP